MEGAHRQHYGITLAVLATAALAYAVSQTMVVPALPAIQKDLHTTTTGVTWVLTVYLLTASIATPVLGRLGDMFGKEHVLVAVLCAFAVGSLVAALSHSIGVLVAGRAIQGFAGAVFPLAFGIIRDEFPPERVAQGIGLISATFGIGGGIGLIASGVIVDHLSYEWIFWIALIVTAIAIVCTVLFVPESPIKVPAKVDWAGAALLSVGLGTLLLGISEGPRWGWISAKVLGLFAAAVVAFVLWVRFELRVPVPLVDMRMMRRRAVWSTNLAALLVGFGMFGSFILIPQFVQAPPEAGYGFDATVTEAGLILLPSTAVMLFAGPIAGWLGGRLGSRLPLLIGTLLAAVAFLRIALAHEERWELYIGTALMGAGIGFAFAAMANLIVEAVDPTETGVATGMNTIMRTLGGSLGGQISATIVAAHVIAGTHIARESGYTAAFLLSATVMLLAFGATLLVPVRARVHTRVPA
ncbi:MAG TPA: MFS transporter [Burkholderiaceae bacterium]|nr:MFS transporter [Burkholderiaceae bacterium]